MLTFLPVILKKKVFIRYREEALYFFIIFWKDNSGSFKGPGCFYLTEFRFFICICSVQEVCTESLGFHILEVSSHIFISAFQLQASPTSEVRKEINV